MKKYFVFLPFVFFFGIVYAQDSIVFIPEHRGSLYYNNITEDKKYSFYIIYLSSADTVIHKFNKNPIIIKNINFENDTFLICVKKNNKLFYNTITAYSLQTNLPIKNGIIEYSFFNKKNEYCLSFYKGHISLTMFLFMFINMEKYELIRSLIY